MRREVVEDHTEYLQQIRAGHLEEVAFVVIGAYQDPGLAEEGGITSQTCLPARQVSMSELILFTITGVLGSVITFWLSVRGKQGAVRASALLSLLVGIVFLLLKNTLPEVWSSVPAAFMGASFVGMASPKVLGNAWWVALSGGLFGLIFINTSQYFTGYGGGLGTTADIAVVAALGLLVAFKR